MNEATNVQSAPGRLYPSTFFYIKRKRDKSQLAQKGWRLPGILSSRSERRHTQPEPMETLVFAPNHTCGCTGTGDVERLNKEEVVIFVYVWPIDAVTITTGEVGVDSSSTELLGKRVFASILLLLFLLFLISGWGLLPDTWKSPIVYAEASIVE